MSNVPAVLVENGPDQPIALHAVGSAHFEAWAAARPARERAWLAATAFQADAGAAAVIAGDDGRPASVVLGLGKGDDPWVTGGLAKSLPRGCYALAEVAGADDKLAPQFATWAALAWALGAYAFKSYKSPKPENDKPFAQLIWPKDCDRAYVERAVAAASLSRDLINTPAADMLPDALAAAAAKITERHGAQLRVVIGDELIAQNYPMIHAVGRASSVAPRLIDLTWGDAKAAKVTLVGKGVCFDSGGLDLKPSSAMLLMKKDMGGAATMLGLADMIMAAKLNVRLRLMIPAVENAVSGNSFRPGDILNSRKGVRVEIGNTDAEGRLVLADALCEAAEEKPALLLDAATLTGAARSALGPELPALFTDDETLAADFAASAARTFDPVWRLPLWSPYRKMIDSKVGDINNAGDSPFAGAITAALFLKEFVGDGVAWAHLDTYAWNAADRPGRPQGGEALAQRAMFDLIARRFGG